MYTMPMDDARRQWFAQQVCDEAEVIETALAKHSCDTEKYNGYVGRYFLEKYVQSSLAPHSMLEF